MYLRSMASYLFKYAIFYLILGSVSEINMSEPEEYKEEPPAPFHWHDTVNDGLRQQIVYKLVQAIVPGVQKTSLNEPKLLGAVSYARRMEEEFYNSEMSRSDYYYKVAEKIYKIKKEIERTRDEKKDEETYEDIIKRLQAL